MVPKVREFFAGGATAPWKARIQVAQMGA